MTEPGEDAHIVIKWTDWSRALRGEGGPVLREREIRIDDVEQRNALIQHLMEAEKNGRAAPVQPDLA